MQYGLILLHPAGADSGYLLQIYRPAAIAAEGNPSELIHTGQAHTSLQIGNRLTFKTTDWQLTVGAGNSVGDLIQGNFAGSQFAGSGQNFNSSTVTAEPFQVADTGNAQNIGR